MRNDVDAEFILNDLPKHMQREDIEWIKGLPKDELITAHHSLGRFIRNKYKLWELKWTPELVDGVDYSKDHPDSISQEIIEEFHRRLNTV